MATYCTHCGLELKDGDIFCPSCGTKAVAGQNIHNNNGNNTGNNTGNNIATAYKPVTNSYAVSDIPPRAAVDSRMTPGSYQVNKPKKHRNIFIILISVITAFIVLTTAVIGGVLFLNKSTPQKTVVRFEKSYNNHNMDDLLNCMTADAKEEIKNKLEADGVKWKDVFEKDSIAEAHLSMKVLNIDDTSKSHVTVKVKYSLERDSDDLGSTETIEFEKIDNIWYISDLSSIYKDIFGINDTDNNGESSDSSDAADHDNSDTSSTDTNTPENSSPQQKIMIGGIGPITGTFAFYGQSVKKGADLAVKEINNAGGINGMLIDFLFVDDEADSTKAVNAYDKLLDKGIKVLMGPVTSGATTTVVQKTMTDQIFELSPTASSPDIFSNGNFFRVCYSDYSQGTASANYIGSKGLASKVAIIYDNSDMYSTGIYQKFLASADDQHLNIVTIETFTTGNTDFSLQLQNAKEAGAELVFLPVYYNEAALILTQASQMDYNPIFFGCDGLDGILSAYNFDTTLADGLMILYSYAAEETDSNNSEFVTNYQVEYMESPNLFSAYGYDAIYILKAAMEKAGVTSDMSASDINEALKIAMTQINFSGLTGMNMTWDSTGDVSKDPKVIVIQNGSYETAY